MTMHERFTALDVMTKGAGASFRPSWFRLLPSGISAWVRTCADHYSAAAAYDDLFRLLPGNSSSNTCTSRAPAGTFSLSANPSMSLGMFLPPCGTQAARVSCDRERGPAEGMAPKGPAIAVVTQSIANSCAFVRGRAPIPLNQRVAGSSPAGIASRSTT